MAENAKDTAENRDVHFVVIKMPEAYFAHFAWPSQLETMTDYRQSDAGPQPTWWLRPNSIHTAFEIKCATFDEAFAQRETMRQRMERPAVGGHLTDGGYFIDSTQFNEAGGYKIWRITAVQ